MLSGKVQNRTFSQFEIDFPGAKVLGNLGSNIKLSIWTDP